MKTISTTRPLWLGLAMAAIGLWASAGGAMAGPTTLWYNGDFNGKNGLANELIPGTLSSAVYDDFIVPVGQKWTVDTVFSNDLTSATVSSAYWEIRSNVMAGDGGNLLYSGTDSASQTATGRTGFGLTEYTVAVDVSAASPPVTLGAGTYWLAVVPIISASDVSDISTTSGANAVGMPPGNDNNSFINSPLTSPFEPASDFVGSPADFSMGVTGIAITSVPEPSTLVLGLVATLTVFGAARLRRRTRVG
jgi:hypothetical protein